MALNLIVVQPNPHFCSSTCKVWLVKYVMATKSCKKYQENKKKTTKVGATVSKIVNDPYIVEQNRKIEQSKSMHWMIYQRDGRMGKKEQLRKAKGVWKQ